MAEESTRSPRSALVVAQTGEDLGRRLDTGGEDQWLGKILERAGRRFDLTRGTQSIEPAPLRQRREQRHRAPAIGDLIVSPSATRPRSSLARCLSSRIPAAAIGLLVAQSTGARKPQ